MSDIKSLADVSTAIAAPIGMIGILFAAATLLSSARTARLQHMHGLFNDYLKLQFDYHALTGLSKQQSTRLRRDLGSFKMYTLEEMTLWLRRERRWAPVYLWSRFHRRHVQSWQDTINWHLDDSSDDDFVQFASASACYGHEFILAVERSRERRRAARALCARHGMSGADHD